MFLEENDVFEEQNEIIQFKKVIEIKNREFAQKGASLMGEERVIFMSKKENINWKDRKNSKKNETEEFNDQIEGRNAVLELLESGKDISKIYIDRKSVV